MLCNHLKLARYRIQVQEPYSIVLKENTLVSLIIVQDGINVQAGKILKINKRAGWNKAVQDGIFHFSLMKIHIQAQNFPNLINVQDEIRQCRMEFFKN